MNDHNQFKYGILAFDKRYEDPINKFLQKSNQKRLYSYLIFDFNLPKDIHLNDFTIEKSIEVDINITTPSGQPVKKAYVSPVKMPERINDPNSHLFTLGLSAVCSFAFERPVFSNKNDYYNRQEIANLHELKEIGVEFPRTVSGPGVKGFRVHNDIVDLWENRLKEVVNFLDKLTSLDGRKYPICYEDLMQCFRLIQLAHINKKEDFDLGYSFLIAGIEAISQLAIDRIDFSNKHEHYSEWERLSKDNEIAKSLFDEYLKVKTYVNSEIHNRDLTKRFVKFLISFSNEADWEGVFYDELLTEGPHNNKLFIKDKRVVPEITPNKLTEEEFSKIIKNTYQLRSKFFHAGQPLPHKIPTNSSDNRFFQVIDNEKKVKGLFKKMEKERRNKIPFSELRKTQDILITFEFMSNLARNSIVNYIKNVLL